ncbi:MAG TPA: hypothetical protein VFE84_13255 [Patescibacteria group bacterium]|nr:hypothetical protein [Patescibacteria group bacterium]
MRTMPSRKITIALLATFAAVGFGSFTWAQQQTCAAPTAACSLGSNVTTSQIQIGGPGSISSNNTIPATCDGGTPGNLISARYDFSFDRAAGQLTVTATNTTQAPNAGALTGFGFNVTSDVTLMTLASQTAGGLTWSAAFDRDRNDNVIEIPVGSHDKDIKCDGFGRVNVFGGNKGVDTGFGGGSATEILPGNAKTFVFNVTGNLANVSACTFTSVASLIPPGDKTVLAVGRFQACNGGGSAWAGPCTPTNLLVNLVDFKVKGNRNNIVEWETATEIDSAGFYVLVRDERTKEYRRVNTNLIPSQGSEVSGAFYHFEDVTAVNGKKNKYILEEMETSGNNNIYFPKAQVVVVNPANPDINLLYPAYEQPIDTRGGTRLKWESANFSRRQVIEISSDATFPQAGTLTVNAGNSKSRNLSHNELSQIEDMSVLSGEGGVYWRVRGKNSVGAEGVSQTYFMPVAQ